MKIITTIEEVRQELDNERQSSKIISFVPTMGYLHEGHLSLVRNAKNISDYCVVSIYVNPTQFGRNEDFGKYPRDAERDINLLKEIKCDLVFIPDNKIIYPENYLTYVSVERVTKILEGKIRPTHFKGVTTIVAKLFNIIQPDYAVFGQKDAQQAFVINKMVDDLNFRTRIIVAPIVREKDGLAMSSRNVYLNRMERKQALILNKTLKLLQLKFNLGEKNFNKLINYGVHEFQKQKAFNLDYLTIVNKTTFIKEKIFRQGEEYYILIAARNKKLRLIDNIIIN